MDTITHGIAGALIGKAVFRGEDMFAAQPMNRGRIITWSLVLGAIFPDSDVIRDFFSSDKLLIVTWHRSITHRSEERRVGKSVDLGGRRIIKKKKKKRRI